MRTSRWTNDELDRIGQAEELALTAAGATVTIWVVRAGDGLYVRSWRGRGGAWFRRVAVSGEGHVSASGVDRDVVLVEAGDAVNDAVDDAFRTKYGRYSDYIAPMIRPEARATTRELAPAD